MADEENEEGITIIWGDDRGCIVFDTPLASAREMHMIVIKMARGTRTNLESMATAE